MQWSNWEDFEFDNPYVDWWAHSNQIELKDNDSKKEDSEDLDKLIIKRASESFLPSNLEGLGFDNLKEVPIPEFADNSKFYDYIIDKGDWMPPPSKLPCIPNDTIIVGVIDTGIALGHNRFRDKDGKSRVLVAWQQNGARDQLKGFAYPYLPFGVELYKDDIDNLIDHHAIGGTSDSFDEEAFNQASGVLDMKNQFGHREIAGRYAHGTHVLDAAAGICPDMDDSEFARRVRIIAVNFPTRLTFGLSGTFLDQFMEIALRRIADLSDAIWKKNNPNAEENEIIGYQVVTNISFGKQAGSKDNLDRFAEALSKFKEDRVSPDCGESKKKPLHVVMPVGNDNLLMSNAFFNLGKKESGELTWRVQPEDHSSNYMEIWSEFLSNWECLEADKVPIPLKISVTQPNQKESPRFTQGVHNKSIKLDDYAEIYCQAVLSNDKKCYRIRYVICTAPTYRSESNSPISPSGTWQISVKNSSANKGLDIYLTVQTDQSILPNGSTGLRSYFDHSEYVRYDEKGALMDSYRYPEITGNNRLDNGPVVYRHGTMNASAAHDYCARIAGFQSSDGKPAPYSATGWGYQRTPTNAGAPTVSLPTDDGPTHFGILASGSANGSVVAMRGTSFASAQATRLVVQDYLSSPDGGVWSENKRLFNIAKGYRENDQRSRNNQTPPFFPSGADIEKTGGGRIPNPLDQRVSRTGREKT